MNSFKSFVDTYFIQINNSLSEALNQFIETGDHKNLSMFLFGFSSKKTSKFICEKIFVSDDDFSFVDFPLAWKIHLFSKKLSFNKDLVFSAIEQYSVEFKEDLYTYENLNLQTIKRLKKNYQEQRLLNLFFSSDFSLVGDINKMLNKVVKSVPEYCNYLPKKPKDLKMLHDKLMTISSKIGDGNYSLNQREDILHMENQVICANYIIKIPKTHFDLVSLGERLNFCIGNGVYSKDVLQKKTSIISINCLKTDKALYGIEFNRYAIKQARGFDNRSVPDKILVAIENLLISRPDLPDDFVSLENHPFIQGYKYNNKDLFVLFKTQSIYAYEGMSEELYEQFEKAESKSKFFHNFIKPLSYLRIK